MKKNLEYARFDPLLGYSCRVTNLTKTVTLYATPYYKTAEEAEADARRWLYSQPK